MSVDTEKELENIARCSEPLVFAGAGIPTASGIPTWQALLKEMQKVVGKEYFDKDINKQSEYEYPQLAQEIYTAFKKRYGDGGHDEYLKAIREILIPSTWGHSPCQPEIVHTFNNIVTTNFDSTFEDAIDAYNRYSDRNVIHLKQSLPDIKLKDFHKSKYNLVYLHGNLAENVIFKKEDYDRFHESDHLLYSGLWEFYKSLYADYSIVFIGFSFGDIYIKNMFRQMYSSIEKV